MPAMKSDELSQALPFEAQRYLPFSLQDVVIDGVVLGPAEAGKFWVLIVACKRELLERRINWIKQADLEPAIIDIDALALANAFLEQSNGQKLSGTHALINVGAQWTNLVVLKGDAPYLIRDIPWGSEKLTRHMAEQLGVEAAAIASQLTQEGGLSPELAQAMNISCEALTVELQLSFDFFESRFGPPPDQLLVSGGLSQSPGFLEALKSHLTHPLTSWAPGTGLTSRFAVAYGLALRTAAP
jgi:type IV pilus assembly protein PilM